MATTGFNQCPKAGRIQFVIAEGIEAQSESVTEQVGLFVSSICSECFLKLRPGYAEIVLSSRSRQVRPEQAKQKFTTVRVTRFAQKIGEQSDCLTVGEGDCSRSVMLNLQLTE